MEAFHHQAVAWLSRMSFPQHKLHSSFFVRMRAKLLQSCPTLCNLMDCSLPGFYVHGDSPGKNTGVGCHFLLQRIFPTQGSNLSLCLLYRRGICTTEPPGKPSGCSQPNERKREGKGRAGVSVTINAPVLTVTAVVSDHWEKVAHGDMITVLFLQLLRSLQLCQNK